MGIKPLSWTLVVAILAALTGGCTAREISRNIYEGARAQAASQRGTAREQSRAPMPSYDQYERERQVGR
ncbi:MAG: hypothetical protein WCE38_18900 [Burkholderiales bacterium]